MSLFKCTKLIIKAEALDFMELPAYKGSVFRGAFGNAFRKTVCVAKSNSCTECILINQCLYSYAFESPVSDQSMICKNYSFAPHPFILIPPLDTRHSYEAGHIFHVELILIGKAIESLPYFIYAMIRMGELGLGKQRGQFRILSAKAMDENSKYTETIYQNETMMPIKTILTLEHAQQKARQLRSDQIALNFITPLRIQKNGQLNDNPSFNLIMKNCFRRMTSLLYFHCQDQSPPFYEDAIEQSKYIQKTNSNTSWQSWSRYSSRQKKRHKLGGLIGEMRFEGDLATFLPYLVACSWVNLGKGTAFGLGKYVIQEVINPPFDLHNPH